MVIDGPEFFRIEQGYVDLTVIENVHQASPGALSEAIARFLPSIHQNVGHLLAGECLPKLRCSIRQESDVGPHPVIIKLREEEKLGVLDTLIPEKEVTDLVYPFGRRIWLRLHEN